MTKNKNFRIVIYKGTIVQSKYLTPNSMRNEFISKALIRFKSHQINWFLSVDVAITSTSTVTGALMDDLLSVILPKHG